MPKFDDQCAICTNEDLRLAVDSLLYLSYGYREAAAELGRAPEFADTIKRHLLGQHVRYATRDTYTLLLVKYLQDQRRMEKRELERRPEFQRTALLMDYDKRRRWAYDAIAKLEGFYREDSKKLPGEAQRLLEALASTQPEIAARIQNAQPQIAAQPEPEPVAPDELNGGTRDRSGDD
jgi:hypothetical protein